MTTLVKLKRICSSSFLFFFLLLLLLPRLCRQDINCKVSQRLMRGYSPNLPPLFCSWQAAFPLVFTPAGSWWTQRLGREAWGRAGWKHLLSTLPVWSSRPAATSLQLLFIIKWLSRGSPTEHKTKLQRNYKALSEKHVRGEALNKRFRNGIKTESFFFGMVVNVNKSNTDEWTYPCNKIEPQAKYMVLKEKKKVVFNFLPSESFKDIDERPIQFGLYEGRLEAIGMLLKNNTGIMQCYWHDLFCPIFHCLSNILEETAL